MRFPWQTPRWRVQRRKKVDQAQVIRMRLAVLRVVIVAVFLVLAGQLWRLQIVEGARFQRKAEANRLRLQPVAPLRGVIYDRNRELLVRNVPSFSAAVTPADITEEQEKELAPRLEAILGVPASEISRLITERRTAQLVFDPVPIKTGLSRDEAFLLEEHRSELPGVQVLVEPVRSYLTGADTAVMLGFMGRINAEEYTALKDQGYGVNDKVGKMGVEYSYEGLLRGKPGLEQVEVDVNGRTVQVLESRPPEPGGNLVLSIDVNLQREATRILGDTLGPTRSQYAVAAMMDVNTGELLAMVSLPTYDNNVFSAPDNEDEVAELLLDPRKPMLNYAISGQYPPGSIFKTVTGTAALQEGVATPATRIFSPGVIYLMGWPFYDWAALGSLDFYRGLAMSSDVYFYYLAGGYSNFEGLGPDRLARYARDYGMGELTGIDLPGEVAGNVPDSAWKERELEEPWRQGDSYNYGIGQGYLTATPLEMLRVVAAIANGGKVLQPRVLHEVVDSKGQPIMVPEPKVLRQVNVSQQNLAIMRDAMRQTVATGTATTAKVPGVEVAGKTGTAEFFKLAGTRDHLAHGWFFAFAPYEKPEVAIIVFQQQGNGAMTAAPVASKILRYYFEKVRPTR